MWVKSIYGKAAFKRLKLYICRAGIVSATSECQWPCGLQWVVVRDFRLGRVLAWGAGGTVGLALSASPYSPLGQWV